MRGDQIDRRLLLTSEQCRAARNLLNITKSELAELVGVRRNTIGDFEKGAHISSATTLMALRKVFEDRGIVFLWGKGMRGAILTGAEELCMEMKGKKGKGEGDGSVSEDGPASEPAHPGTEENR